MFTVLTSSMVQCATRTLLCMSIDYSISLGDIIQFLVLVLLSVYTFWTYNMARSNKAIAEYTVQPVLVAFLERQSQLIHIQFCMKNLSKTHAIGLVNLTVTVDGRPLTHSGDAYSGKQVWQFPAESDVHGHEKMTELATIENPEDRVQLWCYSHYKVWYPKVKDMRDGRKYYGIVKRWTWRGEKGWVPELTSNKVNIPPEPDWSLLEG